jgi:hypothetical protein
LFDAEENASGESDDHPARLLLHRRERRKVGGGFRGAPVGLFAALLFDRERLILESKRDLGLAELAGRCRELRGLGRVHVAESLLLLRVGADRGATRFGDLRTRLMTSANDHALLHHDGRRVDTHHGSGVSYDDPVLASAACRGKSRKSQETTTTNE